MSVRGFLEMINGRMENESEKFNFLSGKSELATATRLCIAYIR